MASLFDELMAEVQKPPVSPKPGAPASPPRAAAPKPAEPAEEPPAEESAEGEQAEQPAADPQKFHEYDPAFDRFAAKQQRKAGSK